MLWPLILPATLTACIFAGVIACMTLVAPLLKFRRLPMFLITCLLGLLAFVPSCTGVMAVVDARRFGLFTYKTAADVGDFRVDRYLPPTATNITLHKHAQGFRARYTISEAELMSYLDDLWARYGHESVTERGQLSQGKDIGTETHRLAYGDLGWPYLPDAVEFHSPTAANGAGFSVWFSPSKQIAYEDAGYW